MSTIVRTDNWPRPAWRIQDVDDTGAPVFDEDGAPVLMDLTGSDFVLTVRGAGVSLVLASAADALEVDIEASLVTWPITQAQAARFPLGRAVSYTLQRIIDGKYQTLVADSFRGDIGPSAGVLSTVLATGPIGPTGDVTPEAVAAQEAAEAAATVSTTKAAEATLAAEGNSRDIAAMAVRQAEATVLVRSGGRAHTEYLEAAVRALLEETGSGRTISTINTVADVVTDFFRRVVRSELQVGGGAADGGVAAAQEDVSSVILEPKALTIAFGIALRLCARPGRELLTLDAVSERLRMDLSPTAPPRAGDLWEPVPGQIAMRPEAPPWSMGRFYPLGQDQPFGVPRVTGLPEVVYPEDDTEGRDKALYEFAPAIAFAGGKLWAVFVRNNILAAEGAGSYHVIRYSKPPFTTWSDDIAYIVAPADASHMGDVQAWTDPLGHLHIIHSVYRLDNVPFITVITDVYSDRPVVPPPVRPRWYYGVPSKPAMVGGRALVSIDVVRTSNFAAEYEGSTIVEYDWQNREFIKVGKLPDEPDFSFPEASLWQRRDGAIAHLQRTAVSGSKHQKISTSAAGDPNAWTQPAVYTALGDNPITKARVLRSPYTGALYCAFNNDASGRLNMTLAVSMDDETFPTDDYVLLDAGSGDGGTNNTGSVSYPDIAFDGTNVHVIFDKSRANNPLIIDAIVPEAAAIAGGATATLVTVDAPSPPA